MALAAGAVVLVALNLRIAVTSVPPILADLGLSAAGQSLLPTLPVLLFGAGAAAAPALRKRLGEEQAIFAALVLLLAGMLARAVWPQPALFPGTVVACAGIAVVNVLLPSFIRRRFPEHVGLVMGLYTTALIGGASVAAGLTIPVREAGGGSNGFALGAWALPVVVALLAWAPLLRGAEGRPPDRGASGGSLWRDPLAWQVTLFMGLQSLTYFAPLAWLPTIYRDEGGSPATAGVLLAIFNGVGVVTSLAAPVLAGRRSDQRAPLAATVALTALGVVVLLLAPKSGAVAWAVLLGLGQGGALALALLMIVLRASDDDTAARLSSMAQSVGYLLAAFGPLILGVLYAVSGSWTLPLLVLLGIVLLELAVGLPAARDRVVATSTPASDTLELPDQRAR